MTTKTLEDRLAVVESELTQIKQQLAAERPQPATSGWERIFGSFADSEGFEEAVRLGREYREAQNAEGSDEAA